MDLEKLKAPFPADRISWRIGSTTADKSKGMALAYIDARDVQDRLDEVCGVDGWQCRYVPMHDKKTVCEIGIRIFREEFSRAAPQNKEVLQKEFGYGSQEWVWKADGAGDSDVEAEKGALSDAFKRAAVKWGIGRYLYDIESPWVEVDTYEKGGKVFVKGIKSHEYARLESLLNRSKPSSAVTPRTHPSAATHQEAHLTDAASGSQMTPAQWFMKGVERVGGLDIEGLTTFTEKHHDRIAKMRVAAPDEHKLLMTAIKKRYEVLQ